MAQLKLPRTPTQPPTMMPSARPGVATQSVTIESAAAASVLAQFVVNTAPSVQARPARAVSACLSGFIGRCGCVGGRLVARPKQPLGVSRRGARPMPADLPCFGTLSAEHDPEKACPRT